MNRELIEKYTDGAEKLSLAIRGLTREDLLVVPPADANVGLWSIQQVVIHCMDSELISTDRMKRMIAEENPALVGYDESKFAANLFYHEQPADAAVQIVALNRKSFAEVLRRLPESAFRRGGNHSERGRVALGDYLKSVVEHLEHHLHFIHKKRAHLGKEMW